MRKILFITFFFFVNHAQAFETEKVILSYLGKNLDTVTSLGELSENEDYRLSGDTPGGAAYFLITKSNIEFYIITVHKVIKSISTRDKKYKTSKNISVGNTLKQLASAYPERVEIANGTEVELKNMKFYLRYLQGTVIGNPIITSIYYHNWNSNKRL